VVDVPDVVALDLPGGPPFVDAVRGIWDDGDAALVLDRRWPAAVREATIAELRPVAIVDSSGRTPIAGARPAEEGDALVVVTSGTTGVPKGAVLTHEAVRASAHASSTRLGVDDGSDRWLCCLPLAHVGGLSVVTRALVTGTALTVHDGFDAAAVAEAARDGATLVSLVPTALGRVEAAAFRTVLLGGSRIPADRPPNCIATYGMTETGSGVVYDGRPLDGVEVRIDEDGVIALRCPMLLRAYRSATGDTDPRTTDGWFTTGDAGSWSSDGRLSVSGRVADVIVTGGEKVWPEPVEERLRAHPAIVDAALVGVPDDEWGQRVVAMIESTVPPSLAAVRDFVAETLPRWCAPREVRVLAPGQLPRTSLGKIRRREVLEGWTR
jgi:o-succinylbenzoate---CoA ligase